MYKTEQKIHKTQDRTQEQEKRGKNKKRNIAQNEMKREQSKHNRSTLEFAMCSGQDPVGVNHASGTNTFDDLRKKGVLSNGSFLERM